MFESSEYAHVLDSLFKFRYGFMPTKIIHFIHLSFIATCGMNNSKNTSMITTIGYTIDT